MVQRMYDQKWPHHVVKWVESFLIKRTAAIMLQAYTQKQTATAGSLPQGSPVSPILFMLFLSPLLKERGERAICTRRGYADDILLTISSNSLKYNTKLLKTDLKRSLEWC